MLLNGLEANLRGSPRAGAVEGDQRPGPHDDPLIASNEATQTRDSAVNESQSGVAPEVSELGAGRYQVLRVLGEGGFGKIFLAQDTELDRKVAIKLPRFTAGDGSHVEEFRKEARLAASLKHPAIVTVHDVAWEKNGTVFVVMEYVDGKPLSHLLQTQRVPLKHAISLMTRIAEAVHHAHINGLLGRRRCRELAGVDSSDCSILGGRLGGAEGRPE